MRVDDELANALKIARQSDGGSYLGILGMKLKSEALPRESSLRGVMKLVFGTILLLLESSIIASWQASFERKDIE